jgi:hypothetical protein
MKSGQAMLDSASQINTRVWLTELSQALGRPATLDDIPDAELGRLGLVPNSSFATDGPEQRQTPGFARVTRGLADAVQVLPRYE